MIYKTNNNTRKDKKNIISEIHHQEQQQQQQQNIPDSDENQLSTVESLIESNIRKKICPDDLRDEMIQSVQMLKPLKSISTSKPII